MRESVQPSLECFRIFPLLQMASEVRVNGRNRFVRNPVKVTVLFVHK